VNLEEEIKNAIENKEQLTRNTYKTLVKKILKHTNLKGA
jgi:hypothetical protein